MTTPPPVTQAQKIAFMHDDIAKLKRSVELLRGPWRDDESKRLSIARAILADLMAREDDGK